MCTDCGCREVNAMVFHRTHEPHPHPTHQPHTHTHTLELHEKLLSKNEGFARQNRTLFQDRGLLVLNILSSPGSGKTTLIERMAQACCQAHPEMLYDYVPQIGVIVGDLATENDAQRLRAAGATAVQITTGTACHLEADMVAHAASHLDLAHLNLLIIENVGNLVCPAAYDLGETLRVVLLSVTEGEDKPLKYPTVFQSADVVILSKIDIAEAVGFDRDMAISNVRRRAPQAQLFEISARTGFGMDTWLSYLRSRQQRPLVEVGR